MSRSKSSVPLGATLIVLSSLFYASYGVWTTLMGNFFGGYSASALRSILVLFICLPLAMIYRRLQPIDWSHNYKYLTGMLIASAIIWGPFYYAILHAGVGVAVSMNYGGYMIGMFFFSWLFTGERFTKDKWLSCFLGLLGLYLIFSPNVSKFGWLTLAAAAISGFAAALNVVMIKLLTYNTTQSTVTLWVMSAIGNIAMALVVGEKFPHVSLHIQWLYLVFFAIASIIASWLFIFGLKLVEAGVAGILGLLEIAFGVAFGYLCFSQHIGIVTLIGIVVIIAAAAIPYIRDFNARKGTLDG